MKSRLLESLIIVLLQFDNKSVQSFTEDDIVNMYPIVKHINPRQVLNLFLCISCFPPNFILSTIIFRATDAYNFYTTGQSKIQQGFLKVQIKLTLVNFKIPVVLKCSNC